MYSVLIHWDQIVFRKLEVSINGDKAYQNVRLRDARSGDWMKVKWMLSKREPTGWVVDTVLVSTR